MKKISSMNNSLYRLELVSGNKLQKIFTICHNAFPYLILPVWFPLLPPPPPFPSPLPAPWGGADIVSCLSPQKKIPYLLLKH